MRVFLSVVAFILTCGAATAPVAAAPVQVSYEVSGSPGQYDLSFSVRQSVPGQILVGFGVYLDAVFRGNSYTYNPTPDEYETPPLYVIRGVEKHTPPLATSKETFTTGWTFLSTNVARFVEAGKLQRFQVRLWESVVPTSVRYFVETQNRTGYRQMYHLTGGADYAGSDCNPCGTFNRFFGTAAPAALSVPAPEAGGGLAVVALALLAALHKRRRPKTD